MLLNIQCCYIEPASKPTLSNLSTGQPCSKLSTFGGGGGGRGLPADPTREWGGRTPTECDLCAGGDTPPM